MNIRRVINWVKAENHDGRYLRIGSALKYLLHLYYFHPRERFINAVTVRLRTSCGVWARMQLEGEIIQRIFHVCNVVADKRRVIVKLPRGDNSYSCRFLRVLRCEKAFSCYKTRLLSLRAEPFLARHVPEIINVRRDGGYTSEFIRGHNLANLRDLVLNAETLPPVLESSFSNAVEELLQNLALYVRKHGGLRGDWALHNLVFSEDSRAIINVDAEGFFSFEEPCHETDMTILECCLREIVEVIRLRSGESENEQQTFAVLRILDEVRRGGAAYSGSGFLVGYHSLKLRDRMFRGQRECSQRLATIPFDFKGKIVVDLGCNCGGMLHALAGTIKHGIGFDYNPKCVNAAQAIRALNLDSNLSFFNFDLDNDELALLPALCGFEKIDICFLLSVCMWLRRWPAVIHSAVMLSDSLLFESNGSQQQQREQERMLNEYFYNVLLLNESSSDDPLQSDRRLFLCTNKRVRAKQTLNISPTNAPALSA